jgi:hypothetical protein
MHLNNFYVPSSACIAIDMKTRRSTQKSESSLFAFIDFQSNTSIIIVVILYLYFREEILQVQILFRLYFSKYNLKVSHGRYVCNC